MSDRLTELGVRLRDFRLEDISATVDIGNRTWPDDPSTIEEEEYYEKSYPQDNPARASSSKMLMASSSA